MGSYTRLGSDLMAAELATDPFGAVHRAVVIAGALFDRHVLVRTFSEELLQVGMNVRLSEAGRVWTLLGGNRVFGQGYRFEGGATPHVAWGHVQGRSLAQLIERAKQEQIPFGIDHALTVIQGVAQGIVLMHSKGLGHGVLSPHSVWVSCDGGTQLMDAPYAGLVQDLLARAPQAQASLACYLQAPGSDMLRRDLFALGAVLYELLTFERLPVGGDLRALLQQATLLAAQEDTPFPEEIRTFLGRLLLGEEPFETVEAFNAELERVLYEGEFNPTIFNMAFFMHMLFREDNDRDLNEMKAEQRDNYLAYTPEGESLLSGATRTVQIDRPAEPRPPQKSTTLLVGGGLAAVVILGLGYFYLGRSRLDPAIQAQLVEFKRIKAEIAQKKTELDALAKSESDKIAQLQKQSSEAKSVEEKARLQKLVEEARQRRLEVERQQKQADQKLLEQKVAEEKLIEPKPATETRLAAQAPTVPVEVATAQPAPEVPRPVVEGVPATPAQDAVPSSEPARLLNQVAPVYPSRARQVRMGGSQEQIVRLKVFVGEQGQALKVSVIEGAVGTFGFDEAAVEAASRSTFSPALRDGKVVRGWTSEIAYKFRRQ